MAANFDDIFNQTNEALASFDSLFQQLQKYESLEELNNQLTLEDQAKLSAALSFALNSLYYVYMKTNGISFENHKILEEKERIKKYFLKIQQSKDQNNQNEQNQSQKIKIDVDSSNRIVQHHLNFNKNNEKQQKMEEELAKEEQKDIWGNDQNNKNEIQMPINKKVKKSQRIHKGALMPKTAHLNWREQLDKLTKN